MIGLFVFQMFHYRTITHALIFVTTADHVVSKALERSVPELLQPVS